MSNKLAEAIQEQIDNALSEVRQSSRQAIEDERDRLAEEERARQEEEKARKEANKPDLFDSLDIFDTIEDPHFKPYVAPPRVEVQITDEIRALIAEQVAAGVARAVKGLKPETRIIEKTIKMPEKVIVKELVDNTAEILKKVETKLRKEIDDLDKSGRFGPIVVPSPIADQNGNGGKVLSTNGANTKWITAPSGGSLDPTTDITLTGAGLGLVVTTPNGLHTYRIAVDNSGVLTTEQLT